jgi:Family of unknown function (DUF5706)
MTDHSEHLRQLLQETREELAKADNKANILLASSGITVGVGLAGLMTGDVSISRLHNSIEWLCWVGVAALVAAVTFLSLAVMPRLAAASRSRAHYFGDFAEYASVGALIESLQSQDAAPDRRNVSQLLILSKIAVRKYSYTAKAFPLLAFSLAAIAGSVIVDTWL